MPVSDSFDRILKRFKSIATPYPRMFVDGDVDCIVGSEGNDARVDVYTRHWEQLKKRFSQMRSGPSEDGFPYTFPYTLS